MNDDDNKNWCGTYKLDENKNVVPSSIKEWSDFIEGRLPTNYKHVGDDIINGNRVSTVFLGLCNDFDYNEKPLVFETMVFSASKHSIYIARHATWQEAEEGHKKAIEWVNSGCIQDE